jgi:diguanylate cyclase (GGDEF)-like protein
VGVSFVHPDDADVFSRRMKEMLSGGGEMTFDFRVVRPDGEVRWMCAHGRGEHDGDGTMLSAAGILQDITERKVAEDARVGDLERAANMDRLTGLHNRRGFETLAEEAIARASRVGLGVGALFCDLDDMKMINDRFGHAQGDRALRELGAIMKYMLRASDAVARVGGDEFVVLVVDEDESTLDMLEDRLSEGLDFFNATNERPYRLSASTGKAWCDAGSACDLERLLATADDRMYANKQGRRSAPG